MPCQQTVHGRSAQLDLNEYNEVEDYMQRMDLLLTVNGGIAAAACSLSFEVSSPS